MYSADLEKIYKTQSDVLIENLTKNPYLPVGSDKAIVTDHKSVIKGINEIVKKLAVQNNTVNKTLAQQYKVLGDVLNNPDLVDKLQKVDANLIEAVLHIDKRTATKDIVYVHPKLSTAILVKQPPTEILFPYTGKVVKILASCSSDNTNRSDADADIAFSI